MDLANVLWLVVVAGGPLLLAILFAYALARRRRLGRIEKAERARATQDVFDERP